MLPHPVYTHLQRDVEGLVLDQVLQCVQARVYHGARGKRLQI